MCQRSSYYTEMSQARSQSVTVTVEEALKQRAQIVLISNEKPHGHCGTDLNIMMSFLFFILYWGLVIVHPYSPDSQVRGGYCSDITFLTGLMHAFPISSFFSSPSSPSFFLMVLLFLIFILFLLPVILFFVFL